MQQESKEVFERETVPWSAEDISTIPPSPPVRVMEEKEEETREVLGAESMRRRGERRVEMLVNETVERETEPAETEMRGEVTWTGVLSASAGLNETEVSSSNPVCECISE